MRALLATTAERAIRYLEDLEIRSVAPSIAAVARLASLDIPLPHEPTSPESVLQQLTLKCQRTQMVAYE